DGQAFDYAAGQAVVIGAHGGEKRRPYSIAASPEDARRDNCLELLVGVDAEGRPGTHLTLEPGAAIDVDGPVGTLTLPPQPSARNSVFIAGGTGIAPLRAMMRHALLGPSPVRHVGLLYSARTPEEFAYEDEFRALASSGILELRQRITRDTERDWSGARG